MEWQPLACMLHEITPNRAHRRGDHILGAFWLREQEGGAHAGVLLRIVVPLHGERGRRGGSR